MFATRFVCLFSIGLLTFSFAAAAAPLHPASQSAQRAYPVNAAEVAADGKLAARWAAQHDPQAILNRLRTLHNPMRRLLFNATLIYSRWGKYQANPELAQAMARRYATQVGRYAAWAGTALDSTWALQQARFILGTLAAAVVNRIEYWSALPADRRELKPLADAAVRLLRLARRHFRQVVTRLNNTSHFGRRDRQRYVQALRGRTQASYYLAFADYFSGLALPPGDPRRRKDFLAATAATQPWTSANSSAGLSYPALLLRGKAELQAGQFAPAQADLRRAQNAAAPWGVQYEAHYQQIAALLARGRYAAARATWSAFEKWLASAPSSATLTARMGARLLAYRIAAASARSLTDAAARQHAQAAALAKLLLIIQQAPQYERLIFSHLAAALPPHPAGSGRPALPLLAYAWLQAQTATRPANLAALRAARAVLARRHTPPTLRAEAALVAAVALGRLGRIEDAAQANLTFVRLAPQDPRAKAVLEVALGQLRQLNAAPAVSPAVAKLTRQAIQLAYLRFHEPQWRLAWALQLAQSGRRRQARRLLRQVPPTSRLYLEARYQLVRLASERLARLQQKSPTPLAQRKIAARRLLHDGQRFLALLDHPPPGISASALRRAKAERLRVLLVQAGAALNPLRDPVAAGKMLNQLTRRPATLSPRLKGILLRYRIRQYQLSGQSQKIIPLIRRYTGGASRQAEAIIMGLIGQYDRESRKARRGNPRQAQRLAAEAADLLGELIVQLQRQPGPHANPIYAYRQLRAAELIRAGRGRQALTLYTQLEHEHPPDPRNFVGAARADFALGDYRHARWLYVKIIPHLRAGSAAFWSAYLYLIRCNQKLGKPPADSRRQLRALLAIYGSAIGGTHYHQSFQRLLQRYNVSG